MGSWVGRLHSCPLAGARAEMAGTITVKKMGGAKVDVPIGPTTTVADVKAELDGLPCGVGGALAPLVPGQGDSAACALPCKACDCVLTLAGKCPE